MKRYRNNRNTSVSLYESTIKRAIKIFTEVGTEE
uniref:Uncharacterized protein n=1 Tax=Siphoviridae sp. ctuUw41 TaxID=2826503 RepID=A0A8S5MYD1_9CAUD|nr:MAG TPA: hypothetical protein [Siphoviridae sp. ctuUw41]